MNAILVGLAATLCSLLGANSAIAEPQGEPVAEEGFGVADRFVDADGSQPGYEYPPVPYDLFDDTWVVDMVDSPTGPWLYALVMNRPSQTSFSLVRLDIDTGGTTVLASAPQSGTIEVSSDGSRLYLMSSSDFLTRCRVREFVLGSGWTWTYEYEGRNTSCNEMVAVPGDPTRLVLSTIVDGMLVLKNGTPEPRKVTGSVGGASLTLGDDGLLYSFAQGYAIQRYRIVADGIVAEGDTMGNANLVSSRVQVLDGRIYAGTEVFDASTFERIGTFVAPPSLSFSFIPESGVAGAFDNTVYFVGRPESSNAFDSSDGRIHLFNATTFEYIDTLSLIDLGFDNIWSTRLSEVRPGEFAYLNRFTDFGKVVVFDAAERRGSAGEFSPVTPQRVLDSRLGIGRPGGSRASLGAGNTFDLQVTGQAGVPSSGVSAVVLNVTGTSPDKDTYLSVYPAGISPPDISNINLRKGETRPNLVTVKVGASGQVSVFNALGNIHVIADVAGYYSTSGGQPGSRFVPVSPSRVLDTRTATGGPKQPLGDNVPLEFSLAGRGLPTSGMTAVAMNVTVTRPTVASYLTVYPGDVTRPEVSNLNYIAGDTVPNQVIVRLPANGVLKFENDAGTADLIVDVVGYYHLDDSDERGRFFPTTPVRFLDTRVDQIFPGDGKVWSDEGVVVTYPDEPYAAWVMNVTVVDAEAEGYITVYPEPGNPPNASNLNFRAGQTLPNHVISPTGPGIGWYNFGGEVHILADYFGGFT